MIYSVLSPQSFSSVPNDLVPHDIHSAIRENSPHHPRAGTMASVLAPFFLWAVWHQAAFLLASPMTLDSWTPAEDLRIWLLGEGSHLIHIVSSYREVFSLFL